MATRGLLMMMLILALGLGSTDWGLEALARDHDDTPAPRVADLESSQRGEDPLQAPRGERR